MRVLIGCESSGVVRDAFLERGHDAWSCDIKPDENNSVRHIQDDIFNVIRSGEYDLFIVHPDCTYLTVSGLHWNKRYPEREEKTQQSLAFVRRLMAQHKLFKGMCFENPVGCISTRICPATQYIQPFEFGHDASKKTGLWLWNLPKLKPRGRSYVLPRMVCGCGNTFYHPYNDKYGCPNCEGEYVAKPRWANQTDSGQNCLGPSESRATERARTYKGIADAMAVQWGNLKL